MTERPSVQRAKIEMQLATLKRQRQEAIVDLSMWLVGFFVVWCLGRGILW